MTVPWREFNTGARYTAEGQIIRWRVVDGKTQFVDLSRSICGVIPFVCSSNHEVHTEYLNMRYDYCGFFELGDMAKR